MSRNIGLRAIPGGLRSLSRDLPFACIGLCAMITVVRDVCATNFCPYWPSCHMITARDAIANFCPNWPSAITGGPRSLADLPFAQPTSCPYDRWLQPAMSLAILAFGPQLLRDAHATYLLPKLA